MLLAVTVAAGPVVVRTTDLVGSPNLYSDIEKRFIPSIQLGSYSLATSHVNEELLNM